MQTTIARRTLLVCAAFALSGCGFRLRGRFSLPFDRIYLDMNRNTPLAARIARQLRAGSDVEIVNDIRSCQAVLRILGEKRYREVVAYNADGDAREYELKMEISFRLSTPDGELYLPNTTISAVREISYDDDEYLSRDSQEALVINEMTSDIVVQIIRRIELARPPRKEAPAIEAPQHGSSIP